LSYIAFIMLRYICSFLGVEFWGLNSGPHTCSTTWATLPALFCVQYFWDRVSWTIYLRWLWTAILWISASWVVRITGELPVPGKAHSFYSKLLQSFLLWKDVEFCQKQKVLLISVEMTFVLISVYMLYYIYWFVYTELSMHPWNETDLIVIYNIFDILLNSVCQYFIENFCFYAHERDWSIIPFFVASLSSFRMRIILDHWNDFMGKFRSTGIGYSLKVW
jgi:hypothetical protein